MADTHFRRATWGMTVAEVMATEPVRPTVTDLGELFLDTTILGIDAATFFNFKDGELASGAYVIDQADDVEDVDAYFRLVDSLTTKYGEPRRESEWRNPSRSYELDTLGKWAKAIATGELKIGAWWRTEDSTIGLFCKEDPNRYNAVVVLKYWDRAIDHYAPTAEDLNLL